MVDTFFGYDEESMDSESSSVASLRMERTPATPDDDLEMVSTFQGGCMSSKEVSNLWAALAQEMEQVDQ